VSLRQAPTFNNCHRAYHVSNNGDGEPCPVRFR
jgi:hypothetical protein